MPEPDTHTTALYKRPPIVEAAIEVKFESELEPEALAALVDFVSQDFPNKTERHHYKIDASNPMQPRISSVSPRTSLTDEEACRTIFLSSTTYLFGQKPPYNGWDKYCQWVSVYLDKLLKKSPFRKVSRIGMRYVNRIDIPTNDSLIYESEYLNIFITLPDYFPPFENYGINMNVADSVLNGFISIRTGLATSPLLDHAALLLDIDVYKDKELPVRADRIMELLHLMNGRAVAAFEQSITDKTRDLFRGD